MAVADNQNTITAARVHDTIGALPFPGVYVVIGEAARKPPILPDFTDRVNGDFKLKNAPRMPGFPSDFGL